MKKVMLVIGILWIAGSAVAASSAPPLFKKGDVNGDGVLTEEEFIAVKTESGRAYMEGKGLDFDEKVPDPAKRYGREFKKRDKNEDGVLSVEEWKAKRK